LPIYGLIEIQVLWFFHYIVILIEIYPWNIIILVHFLGWLLSFRMSTLKSPIIVATLTLGLRPMQGLAKVWAKKEARKSHLMLLGMKEGVKRWTFTFPNEFAFWELESQWTFESSKSNCKGQNPLDWGVPYIIGNLLKRRCLKWARMTHLDI
jgi:hypothetical protein